MAWWNTKTQETLWKTISTKAPFLARYGPPWTPKRSENGHLSQRIGLHFPWDLSTFSAESPIPNAQKDTFLPEVLIQRS